MKMNLQTLVTTLFASLVVFTSATVNHDKVEPFPQPKPVTISEKAAIKFKPQLMPSGPICVPYPAVNADGGVTGGLKGTNKNDACMYAPLGSQVYGRAGWHNGLWAIMYAWYFPKGFWGLLPWRRHDWTDFVVWIDNPKFETPKIIGVSMSKSNTEYSKETRLWPSNFVGYGKFGPRYNPTYIFGSNTSLRLDYEMFLFSSPYLNLASMDGEYQDLIMWEQLTDAARAALSDKKNFGKAKVPFSDEHFQDHLNKAWLY